MKLESHMEALLERLIELQTSSPTFRIAFRSKCLNQFVAFAKVFTSRALALESGSDHGIVPRVLDKFSHLAMMLSLDETTPAAQTHEVSTAQFKPSRLFTLIF